MEKFDIKSNYILNENYMLKYDKKRFILTNRLSHDIYLNKNIEDFPESVNTILHPLLALLFSLFDGYRSKEDIIVKYSEILKISTDVVKKFVGDLFIEFLAEKEKQFIKFDNRLFYIPHNLLLKNKERRKTYTNYNINNFMIHKDELDLKSFRHYYPLDCMLEVNFTCYTDCIYCYADRRNRDKFTISIDRVKEIIKEAKELDMRAFDTCGGELFLYENWEILIKELNDAGFRPYISTKIPISKNEIKKLKNVGQKEIQLSIDSINGDELKKILRVDSNYIEKIKKTLRDLEKENMTVFINSQITNINNNPENIKNMIDYFLTFNNIKRIKIGHIGKSIYIKTDLYNNISSNLDNIKKIEEIVELYKEKCPDININFSGYATKDKYISDDIKIKADNYRNRVKCSGNFYAFIILPNGKVTICEELYFHPAFIIGDIKKQSIMEIWNSERALELYRLPQEKIRDESACKTCKKEEYEICRQNKGVCWKEILISYDYKNWDYPDPKCPYAPMPFNKFWLE